ncbi:MAG: CPBP family glutamic-type intramembrane protease [Phycisphaerae bacterium]|nr:CPBP family glutamic-type intramembrane protease [Phycisphaerae bacterium]
MSIGILVLLLVWSISFLPRDLLRRIPAWAYMIIGTVLFFGFLIVYPFRGVKQQFCFPRIGKIFKEAALAIPLTIGVIVMLSIVNYAWSLVAPETPISPRIWRNAARSTQYGLIAFIMLLATTIGPVAEEIFFRGYLYNAFRVRSGPVIAMIVSSLVFALMHSYGAAPTVVIFLLGICLTAIYRWRKTLLTPIFVHAGINVISMTGLLLAMMMHARTPEFGISGEPHADGVRITFVFSETGAERAGIQVGDIIIEIDGRPVQSISDVIQVARAHKIGDVVQITLIRDNTTMDMSVVLGARRGPAKVERPGGPDDTNR